MRVLVTGGGGFIGTHVLRQLVSDGVSVRSLDIVKPQHQVHGVEYLVGTVLDQYFLSRAMIGCDAVIHLAAVMGVDRCTKNPLTCLNVNVTGTQRVLDAAVSRGVKKVLIASSSEVYGSAAGVMSETSPLSPKSEYAVSKLAAEEYLKAYAREFGFTGLITRFFSVYGPGQVAQFVMSRFAHAVRNKVPIRVYGDGQQVRAFCYVTDAALAVTSLVLRDVPGGIYNVGNDKQPVTIKDLAETFWFAADLKPQTIIEGFAETDRTEDREIKLRRPCINKLRAAIGYVPSVDLYDGVQKLLQQKEIPLDWADSLIPEASAAA